MLVINSRPRLRRFCCWPLCFSESSRALTNEERKKKVNAPLPFHRNEGVVTHALYVKWIRSARVLPCRCHDVKYGNLLHSFSVLREWRGQIWSNRARREGQVENGRVVRDVVFSMIGVTGLLMYQNGRRASSCPKTNVSWVWAPGVLDSSKARENFEPYENTIRKFQFAFQK